METKNIRLCICILTALFFIFFSTSCKTDKSSTEKSSATSKPSTKQNETPKPKISSIQVEFIQPYIKGNVCGRVLNWGSGELKTWRENPVWKVNKGLDGKFEITAKVSPVLKGQMPRILICPIPEEPERCWPQDASEVIDNGVFEIEIYIRLSNWGEHTLYIEFPDEKLNCKVMFDRLD